MANSGHFLTQNYLLKTMSPLLQEPQSQIHQFDHLSSIDSDCNNDSRSHGEALEVLQQQSKLKRNDDVEYQERKRKNLSKYRGTSPLSDVKSKSMHHLSHRDKSKESKRHKRDKSKKSKEKTFNITKLTDIVNDIENSADIENLLNEIENDKFELDQYVSKEEDQTNKISAQMNQKEEELAKKEVLEQDFVRGFQPDTLPNQHHNSISNNSGSFYFNVSKPIVNKNR